MATSIPIAVRGSTGLRLALGPPSFGCLQQFAPVESKSCRVSVFSSDGRYFAYVYGTTLKIVRTDTWSDVAVIEGTKAYFLVFSPKSTYLTSWEPFEITKANPQGSPNLNIYRSENGELVKNFVHKHQTSWEPKWSEDEKLFSKIVNNDVVFYEDDNFERIVRRINCFKVASFSISPMPGNYYVVCHMPGGVGQPSFARLFKYPNLDGQQVIACKSFFQADKVDYHWNAKGTHALLVTSTEQDKTGKSYYGKQGLHFVGTNGQTNVVSLSKEGPIHSIQWSPKGQEFSVIYGLMPPKATLYNLKCEAIFEFGTGARNAVHYNPHGNILLLGGFGNLRGNIETWDVANRKVIAKCDAPDATFLEWCPDGVHFLTATTAPRLRIGNGYKIWHYSGSLVYEEFCKDPDVLYEIQWKKFTKSSFKEPTISTEKVAGIQTKEVKASTQAYRPPSARNRPGITFNLHDESIPAHKPGGEPAVSKNALKQRKKREARKARKAEDGTEIEEKESAPAAAVTSTVQVNMTGDVEKDKKIKNIKKKLDAIAKLKAEQAQGKQLEINQISKINGEGDLLKELNQLQI